ncbi:MAG: energy-coupling factor transporter transmembrane protein EcfT [Clostridia bacterium]|nr:energy-coupling factor transporter transmembrane protein EcfT [Clostridia bacterium]
MSTVLYVPGDSFFHRLDPRVKIIMLILFTFMIFLIKNFVLISIMFGLTISLWLVSGLSIKRLAGMAKLLIGIFAFVIIIQGIFQLGDTYLVAPLIPEIVPLIGGKGRITLEGLLFGVLISYRLLTLICLLPLITMTTPVHHIALGLVKLGLPYKVAYMATTALNLVPSFKEEINTIMEAQKLRAFTVFEEGSLPQKLKAYPALVVPLVIGAMRRAQLMGVAMDARAFGAFKCRSYIEDFTFAKKDMVAVALVVAFFIVMVAVNFIYW